MHCLQLQGSTVQPLGLEARVCMSASNTVSYGKRTQSSTSAMKSSKLQLSTSTVTCLPLSAFLNLCCSHLDLQHYVHRTTQKECKHTSTSQVEFKPMISVFQQHRKVCALCQEATVISPVTTSTICYCYPKMRKTMT